MSRTASDWLVDAIARQGVTHVFGNPGSTELPLLDALARQSDVSYLLGLHEAAVVGMADGYAQATGRLTAVNLHVTPGLLNGLSGIYNARRARVPMLVTVGQQHTALAAADPFLGGDLLSMAAPVAKGAWQVDHVDDMPRVLEEALRLALTPPCGPVVVCVPLDVQSAPAPAVPASRVEVPYARPPAGDDVARAAALLSQAAHPAIVAGDALAWGDGPEALRELVEHAHLPVWGEPHAGRAPLPWTHPRWRGYLPPYGADIAKALASCDLVLALGCPVFRVFGHSPGPLLDPATRLIHVDADPGSVGRNVAPALGVVADPADFARELRVCLAARPPDPRCPGGAHNLASGGDPLGICAAIGVVAQPDHLVVDEALTSTRALRRQLIARGPGNWLAHRGSSLGWGTPAAVGAAIAQPDRSVWVLQGDGGLVFGATALWTAVQRRARVRVVVADNGGYEILRAQMGDTASRVGWALDTPGLDIASLCRGLGVSHVQTCEPRALVAALREADRYAGPTVTVVRGGGA